MEILSNLWNNMFTENKLIMNIVSIPCTFLEIFFIMKIFLTVLSVKSTKRQQLIFIVIASIFSIVSFYFIPQPYYSLIDYLLIFILLKIIFKQSYIKTILSIVASFFIYSLIGSLVLNPFLKISHLTYSQVETIPIYRLMYIACVYVFLIIAIFLLNIKKIHISILEELNDSNRKTILLNIIFAFITLCIQLIITFYYINTYSIFFTLLNFVSLLAYFVVSIISLNKTMNLQIKTEQLQIAEYYNNSLSTLYDSVRGFKHDLNNIIHLIGGYVDANDMDGLKKYYKGLRKDCVRLNNAETLNPNIINNPGIYSLVVSKQYKATELKINLSLEVFFDFNNLEMPVYDFSRILGILLDNAIEAANECKDKQVNLIFRDSQKNNTQIITIENTYKNKNVDTKSIFEKGMTEKKDHMGIGLWEVNEIIKKNNNVVLNTTKDNKYFKQQLEIYY